MLLRLKSSRPPEGHSRLQEAAWGAWHPGRLSPTHPQDRSLLQHPTLPPAVGKEPHPVVTPARVSWVTISLPQIRVRLAWWGAGVSLWGEGQCHQGYNSPPGTRVGRNEGTGLPHSLSAAGLALSVILTERPAWGLSPGVGADRKCLQGTSALIRASHCTQTRTEDSGTRRLSDPPQPPPVCAVPQSLAKQPWRRGAEAVATSAPPLGRGASLTGPDILGSGSCFVFIFWAV